MKLKLQTFVIFLCNYKDYLCNYKLFGFVKLATEVGKRFLSNFQWRRQGLMVGEAHLVGEASIFNVKYIIHECGLPTICRPSPGRYLLGRYT